MLIFLEMVRTLAVFTPGFFCKKKSLGKIHRQNLHNFCPDPWPEVFRPKSRGPSFSLGTAAASQQEVGPNPSRRNAVFYTSRLFPEALKDTAEKRRKWWNIIIKCNQRSFFVRSLLYEIEKNGRNWQRKIHESWDHWFSHTRNQVSECMECQPPHLFQALLECCKLQDLKLSGCQKNSTHHERKFFKVTTCQKTLWFSWLWECYASYVLGCIELPKCMHKCFLGPSMLFGAILWQFLSDDLYMEAF